LRNSRVRSISEKFLKHVVVDPDDPDGEEADDVGREGGPVAHKLPCQRPMSRSWYRQVEGEKGDRDGEDAVAERLQPPALHHRPVF